jgi:hypothetical protein
VSGRRQCKCPDDEVLPLLFERERGIGAIREAREYGIIVGPAVVPLSLPISLGFEVKQA